MSDQPDKSRRADDLSDDDATRTQTLIQFLSDQRAADWKALAQDLRARAAGAARKSGNRAGAESAPSGTTREALLVLADFLAHREQTTGVPREVRELLENSENARFAEIVFNEAMTERQRWLDFSRRISEDRAKRQD